MSSLSLFETPANESREARKQRHAAIGDKYAVWVAMAKPLHIHRFEQNGVEFDKNRTQLPQRVEEMDWNWDLDYQVHSPELADPSRNQVERLLRECGSFPYWPHQNLKQLHDSLGEFDKFEQRVYIIPKFDESPGRQIYDICWSLIEALDDHLLSESTFDPMQLEGPYRFASEMHHAGVYVFRHRLRRIARPIWWHILPGDLQLEIIRLCKEMSDYLIASPPQKYGYAAQYKDYAKWARMACTVL